MNAELPVASAPNRSLSWEGMKPEATWVDSKISYITPIALKVTGHDIETMSCVVALPQSLSIPEFSPLIYHLGSRAQSIHRTHREPGLIPAHLPLHRTPSKPHRGSVPACPALALPEDVGVPEQTLPSVGLCRDSGLKSLQGFLEKSASVPLSHKTLLAVPLQVRGPWVI